MRVGLGGAQRFRALLQSAPGKHQRSLNGADSLQPSSKGFGGVQAYCSTISNQKNASGPQTLTHDDEASQCSRTGDESGISFLQQATGDYDLHTRLAALWSMPSELLFERQQAVAKMLGPAGCGTASHALWLLIRSPQLRHASEANLRNSLRQLHRLVSHTEIDRAAVLTAVYKYPWIVDAMASTAVPPPAAADRPVQTVAQDCSSTGAPAASFSTHAAGQGAPAVSPATWWQELAAVVLELQQADLAEHQSSDSSSSSRGLTMSPTFAAAAVRTYIAVNEVKQRVVGAACSVASLLGPASQPHAAAEVAADTSTSSTGSCSRTAPAPAASHSSFNPSSPGNHPAADEHPPTAVSELMQRLQQQQQQHLLLEQLLAACPHLVVLPPELLLARWNRLLSVVAGCGEAASKLVMHSPYLLVDYNDVEAARLETHQDLKACYA